MEETGLAIYDGGIDRPTNIEQGRSILRMCAAFTVVWPIVSLSMWWFGYFNAFQVITNLLGPSLLVYVSTINRPMGSFRLWQIHTGTFVCLRVGQSLVDAKAWANENVAEYDFIQSGPWYMFRNKGDAVRFKLIWG